MITKYPDNVITGFASSELGYKNNYAIKYLDKNEDIPNNLSDKFELSNYPNPCNPTTTISYTLPHLSNVEIRIYDIIGREVKSYILNSQPSGRQNVHWDGRTNNGEFVSSGVYIYKIKANSIEEFGKVFEKSKKLILLK